MIQGEKIRLIAYEQDHWVYLNKWMSDPYYKYYFRNIPEIMTAQQMMNAPQLLGLNVLMVVAQVEGEDHIIGMCTWDNVRILARSCCVGFLQDKDYKGMGFMKEAFIEFIYYLTHRLGIHKVIAKVAECEAETASKAGYGGFTDKNLIRDEYFMDGKWQNEVWFSMLDKEFLPIYELFKKGELQWAHKDNK
jgi:RimJ/RimL family protein N-acetyltransferase